VPEGEVDARPRGRSVRKLLNQTGPGPRLSYCLLALRPGEGASYPCLQPQETIFLEP
jgi:hypothetical protein